jgi:hypothetical protein
VDGPDEDTKLCFVQNFVKGSGIEIVANHEAPEGKRALAGVWSVRRPDDLIYGDIVLPDGRHVSAPIFADAHPEVDLSRLPSSGIHMSPLDLEDERHPATIETERALDDARRPVPPVVLSAFSEALFQLHRDHAEAPLANWYAVASTDDDSGHVALRRLVAKEEPGLLVSIAVCLHRPFAPPPPRRARSQAPSGRGVGDWFSPALGPKMFRDQVLRMLGERALPFSTDDVELMCGLIGHGTDPGAFSFVASIVRRHFSAHPSDQAVLSAAESLLARAGGTGARRSPSFSALQAAVSGQNVGQGPDNALFDDADHFASPARDAVAKVCGSWPEAWRAVAHFGEARGSRPSRAWVARCEELAKAGAFSDLVGQLLELVTSVEVFRLGDGHWECLLSDNNRYIARGAVWAAASAQGSWRPARLGEVALRCGAWKSSISELLCSSVSLAAVDALAAIDDQASRDQLRQLVAEAPNAALLKKAAAALGFAEPEVERAMDLLRTRRRPTIDRPWAGRWR